MQLVAVQIADPVVAQSLRPVARVLHDLDAVSALKFVQLVGVADDEVQGTALRERAYPRSRNICTSPRFRPAISGGSPQVKPRRKPSFFV